MSSVPTAQLRRFAAGQSIFREGDDGEPDLTVSG